VTKLNVQKKVNIEPEKQMNLPAASGRGILVEILFHISPQAAGNLSLRD